MTIDNTSASPQCLEGEGDPFDDAALDEGTTEPKSEPNVYALLGETQALLNLNSDQLASPPSSAPESCPDTPRPPPAAAAAVTPVRKHKRNPLALRQTYTPNYATFKLGAAGFGGLCAGVALSAMLFGRGGPKPRS